MTDDHVFDPWLYAFDPDAHDADAVAKKETASGYEIRLLVHEDWNGWGESYHVDFCFDQNGEFSNAVLYAGSEGENRMESTMFIRETDRQTVLDQIQSNSGGSVKELDEDPDWGLRVYVTDVSSQGLRLHCERSGGDWPGDLMTGRHWWVEKWNGGQWEVLETRPGIAWATDAQLIGPDASARWNCSFEWAYGPLEPGTYRIGKTFSNVPQYRVGIEQSMEEISRTYYAEFGIEDETDALLRCETALEAFQSQESYSLMTEWSIQESAADHRNGTHIFYKAGEDWWSSLLINTAGTYHLEKDGVQYERTIETVPGNKGNSGWYVVELEDENDCKPWISTFQWDPDKIEYVPSSWPGRDAVSFTVYESFFDGWYKDLPEQYLVTFCFEQGTDRLKAVYLNCTAEPENEEESFEIAVSMILKTGVDVQAMIDRMYQEIAR